MERLRNPGQRRVWSCASQPAKTDVNALDAGYNKREPAMQIQALGYVGVRAKALEEWADFGSRFLGMQRIDKSRSTLAFRMDDRKQRLLVDADGGEGIGFMGWELADARALDALAARLEEAGIKVAPGSPALAAERHVTDLVVLHDPAGNRLEFFHGPESTPEPFVPGRNISGFRTGPLGMGHVVLHVDNIDRVMPFYRELLGFRLSDYWLRPFRGYFMNVNQRHHSLAFIETGRIAAHHMMIELFSLDDVGQGYDLALAQEGRVAVTLGRHSGDYITSFYSWNPSGFMTEYGWGAQSIDPQTWQPFERKFGASLWGHDRSWMTPDKQIEARELRRQAAEAGLRQPVQVIEGNYTLMPGLCPWLDALKKEQKVDVVRGDREAS
jgi:2,3-dihydroxybiphenyl 1,2-dioxygenase